MSRKAFRLCFFIKRFGFGNIPLGQRNSFSLKNETVVRDFLILQVFSPIYSMSLLCGRIQEWCAHHPRLVTDVKMWQKCNGNYHWYKLWPHVCQRWGVSRSTTILQLSIYSSMVINGRGWLRRILADSGETLGRNMLTTLASADLDFVVCVSNEADRMSKEMGGVLAGCTTITIPWPELLNVSACVYVLSRLPNPL